MIKLSVRDSDFSLPHQAPNVPDWRDRTPHRTRFDRKQSSPLGSILPSVESDPYKASPLGSAYTAAVTDTHATVPTDGLLPTVHGIFGYFDDPYVNPASRKYNQEGASGSAHDPLSYNIRTAEASGLNSSRLPHSFQGTVCPYCSRLIPSKDNGNDGYHPIEDSNTGRIPCEPSGRLHFTAMDSLTSVPYSLYQSVGPQDPIHRSAPEYPAVNPPPGQYETCLPSWQASLRSETPFCQPFQRFVPEKGQHEACQGDPRDPSVYADTVEEAYSDTNPYSEEKRFARYDALALAATMDTQVYGYGNHGHGYPGWTATTQDPVYHTNEG